MHAAFAFNAGSHIAERDRGAKCSTTTSKDLAIVTPGMRPHNYPIVGTPFEGKAENPCADGHSDRIVQVPLAISASANGTTRRVADIPSHLQRQSE
ncbi:hypothetical protein QMZ05_04230, partial [Bradyrhizobium sp. INPA03-11B]|uniref:hypothetical protein n=1 Tax=Bradyrhizobium sp. INPA03-11B TaxID=418598 RepID=UPI00338F07FA